VTPLYPQKLALTSPTGGGRSVGIVHSRTKATEFSFLYYIILYYIILYYIILIIILRDHSYMLSVVDRNVMRCIPVHRASYRLLRNIASVHKKKPSQWAQYTVDPFPFFAIIYSCCNPKRRAISQSMWCLLMWPWSSRPADAATLFHCLHLAADGAFPT